VCNDVLHGLCFLCDLPMLSYDERLKVFNLERLELRRLKIDLTEMFKIVNGFSACNVQLHYSHVNNFYNTRGHRLKLCITRVHKNILKSYFTNRVARAWNHLPDVYFNTKLISCFKAALSRFNLNAFLLGQL